MNQTQRFLATAILGLLILGAAVRAQAQHPHAGAYSGRITIELSGAVTQPPTEAGLMIFNVFPDGTVAEIGGDPTGVVNEAGAIAWEPNTFNFTTGAIADGKLTASSSTTENGVTRTLRIEAALSGGGFPQGQTFTGQLLDLNPENGYRGHNAVIHTGLRFIAVGDNGTVALSDDGESWSRSAAPSARHLRAVAYGNGTYVIGGDNGVLFTSTDGINWVPRNSPFLFNGVSGIVGITAAAFGADKFVITSQFGAYATSTDGAAWTLGSSDIGTAAGLTFMNNQFAHWTFTSVRLSNDGVNWGDPVSPGVGNALRKVAHGNGLWIAAGNTGIAVSPDGVAWTIVRSGNFNAVAGGAGRFVARAVGSGGETLYSTGADGQTWRSANALTMTAGRDIAYGNGRFVMIGDHLQFSADGRSWTAAVRDQLQPDFVEFSGAVSGSPYKPIPAQMIRHDNDGNELNLSISGWGRLSQTQELLVGENGTLFLDEFNSQRLFDGQTDRTLHAVTLISGTPWGAVVGGQDGVLRWIGEMFDTNISAYRWVVQPMASPTSSTLRHGNAFDVGSGRFMVGDNGTILSFSLSSASPPTVTVQSSGTSSHLRFVRFITTRSNLNRPGIFIATGDAGTLLVYNSETSAWTSRETGVTARLIGAAYLTSNNSNNENGLYVVVGEDGTVITSPDAQTWTQANSIGATQPIRAFRQNDVRNGRAVGDGGLVVDAEVTADGVHFRYHYAGANLGAAGITHGAGRFVAAGGAATATSLDGRTWTTAPSPRPFSGVAYGNGRFVAVTPTASTIAQREDLFRVSSDGLTWQRTGHEPILHSLRTIIHGSGRFAASGERGTVYTSENGLSWTQRALNITAAGSDIQALAHHNGVFVGVGYNSTSGVIISSTDAGLTWASRSAAGSSTLQSVAYGNGLFVAVGTDGNTVRSTDGVSFSRTQILHTSSSTGSRPSFTAIAFFNGVFMATTSNGQAYVSEDGQSWAERFTGIHGNSALRASVVANGLAVFAGGAKIIGFAATDAGSPYVVQQPQGANLIEGGVLELAATVTGQTPLQLQWTRNGEPLAEGGRFSGVHSLALRVSGLEPADAGDYRLIVSNALGSRASQPAPVSVLGAPVIVSHPVSAVIAIGSGAQFSVTASGTGLSYRWFFNGAPLDSATEPTLVIGGAAASDAGLYHVEVTNPAGTTASAPAGLSVTSASGGVALDLNWPPPIPFTQNFGISAAAVQPDGKILLGGWFQIANPAGGTLVNVARLNADGSLDQGFVAPEPNSEVVAFHPLADGKVLIAGHFNAIGGTTTRGLARLNANGSRDASYGIQAGPDWTGVLSFLARPDGKIFAGGSFTQLGGSSSIVRLGLLGSDGVADTSFTTVTINNQVRTMAFQSDGKIVVGGAFTSPRNRLIRLDGNGVHDTGFLSSGGGFTATLPISAPEVIRLLPAPDDKIFAGGRFSAYNGQNRIGLVRLHADGSFDSSFNLGLPNIAGTVVNDLLFTGGNLLVGGSFASVAGNETLRHLVLVDSTGAPADGFLLNASPNGSVSGLRALPGGGILVAGYFTQFGDMPRPGIARLVSGGGDEVPLAIVGELSPVTVSAGAAATFSVAATGTGTLSFQWWKGGEILTGQTGPSLTLTNVSANDAGEYSVVVTDSSSSVATSSAVLEVHAMEGDFGGWIGEFDIPGHLRGPNDDASGDGISNMTVYALGGNPLENNSSRLPATIDVTHSDVVYPGLTFTRNKNAAGVSIEVTASVGVPFTTPADYVETVEDLGNGVERVTLRATQPLPAITTFFFSVKVIAN